ncbi:unnamed protein product, partial [Mesorhabditis spiculigera]
MSRLVLVFLAYILVAAAFPEYEGLNTTCTKSHDCQVINTAAVGICKDGKCDYELTRGFIYFPFKEVKKNEADIDAWIFSYDKVPDPIFVECQRNDTCHFTERPLSDYEDRRNFTKECEKYRDHWAERTYRHAFQLSKQYSLSFYWSALTLVTLGEQPSPQRSFQNIFEIIVTLLGLVIFAVIVGDVGNMVQTMNLKRTDYEEIFDGTRAYMLRHQVPQQLQQKIIRYLTYIWGQGQIGVDEKAISDFLPNRLYGHMAVHIHMETLRRVPLFADCDPTLLYEFILRLELQVYSPGDYICRKGEVGKEMYIVKSGFVEVVNEDGTKASMDREKQLVTKLEESFVEFFELVNRDDEHEEDSDPDG